MLVPFISTRTSSGRSGTHSIKLLLSLVLLGFGGCYPDWPEHSGRAIVQGAITLDGAPLKNAKIIFVPQQLRSLGDKLTAMAYATSNASGEFELKYSDGATELIAGTYTVIVSKTDGSPPGERLQFEQWNEALVPESVKGFVTMKDDLGETIPPQYNVESTLKVDIKASPGISEISLALNSSDSEIDDLPVIDLPLN